MQSQLPNPQSIPVVASTPAPRDWPGRVFLSLLAGFVAYSVHLYAKEERLPPGVDLAAASEGQLVWQKYNCQACHQLYGLRGFLGPDLTNVYSAPGKGAPLVSVLVRYGTGQMPAFPVTSHELVVLTEFLKSVDATGSGDPRRFRVWPSGMIDPAP